MQKKSTSLCLLRLSNDSQDASTYSYFYLGAIMRCAASDAATDRGTAPFVKWLALLERKT